MNKNILLVDDDHRLRDLLKDYLSEKKLNIYTCQDFESDQQVHPGTLVQYNIALKNLQEVENLPLHTQEPGSELRC